MCKTQASDVTNLHKASDVRLELGLALISTTSNSPAQLIKLINFRLAQAICNYHSLNLSKKYLDTHRSLCYIQLLLITSYQRSFSPFSSVLWHFGQHYYVKMHVKWRSNSSLCVVRIENLYKPLVSSTMGAVASAHSIH